MKKKLLTLCMCTIVLGLSMLSSSTIAQTNTPSFDKYNFIPRWEVGANVGASLYLGDVASDGTYLLGNVNEERISGDMLLSRQFSYVFGVQVQFIVGKLAGNKPSIQRYFESIYTEINLQAKVDICNLIGAKRTDRLFNVIVPIGVGFMNYNSILYEYDRKTEIDKGKGILPVLLGGIQFQGNINEHWSINFSNTMRLTFSDDLDTMVSNDNDVYNYSSAGISYKF